jgi:hypothetical protein
MEANVVNDAVGTAVHGYSRAEVDEFLQAAAAERSRLESEIADARSRIGRARSAIGMHRVMVAMLLETQRELTEMRARADAEAEAILAQAERDAAMILAGSAAAAPGAIASAPTAVANSASTPIMSTPGPAPVHEIDLGGADRASAGAAPGAPGEGEAGGDEYFDFLRGALADESPLGPGTE